MGLKGKPQGQPKFFLGPGPHSVLIWEGCIVDGSKTGGLDLDLTLWWKTATPTCGYSFVCFLEASPEKGVIS